MGVIVQTPPPPPNPSPSLSCYPKATLSVNNYTLVRTHQNGLTHIRLDSDEPALFLNKRISNSAYSKQKEVLFKWIKSSYKHSTNVLQYQSEKESVFCSSYISFKAVVEYSEHTLASVLTSSKIYQKQLEQSQITNGVEIDYNPLSTLKFIKFLIDATEEQFQASKIWINFHTTNILYFPANSIFKYLYIPLSQDSHDIETFFSPENSQTPSKYNQKTTVFSIGMVLLSLLLKQDCSDCYNYQNFTFCQSVFQQKIQKLQQLSSRDTNINELSYSNIGSTLQQQIADLALAATNPTDSRPSFAEIKSKYYKLLRQISTGYQTGGCGSTIRPDLFSCRRDGSLFDRKQTFANVKGFQTGEMSKAKRQRSEYETSRCVLRDLECQEKGNNSSRKGKENAAIKLKKKLMNKLEQNKQNIEISQCL